MNSVASTSPPLEVAGVTEDEQAAAMTGISKTQRAAVSIDILFIYPLSSQAEKLQVNGGGDNRPADDTQDAVYDPAA